MAATTTRRDPLAPRWLACELDPPRAGTSGVARVTVENAGSATWRSVGSGGLLVAYHWLDERGNPIVWDGRRTPFPRPVAPGEQVEVAMRLEAPRPPGRYVLAVDLVEEFRFWLGEVGCTPLEVPVDVAPRIARRRLAVVVHGGDDPRTQAALSAQEEPLVALDEEPEAIAHLVAGAEPAPGWSRLVLDAHAEGWAAVGPAIVPDGGPLERRRAARELDGWAPGGRNPRFSRPLLLPSLVAGLEVGEHLGLPAHDGPDGVFEGRAAVRLPTRSGRRPG